MKNPQIENAKCKAAMGVLAIACIVLAVVVLL